MSHHFCDVHGGYNNEDNRCLFCDYQTLEKVSDQRKRKSCWCTVKLEWGYMSNSITNLTIDKCRRHET